MGAPRPHTPRQGAQALHRSWDLVCRAYTAILNVPKLRKICRLLWRQIFHSFGTVPPAGALTSPAPPCVGLPHCQSPFGAVVRLGAKDHWLDVGAPRPLKATGHKPSNLTAPFQISAATVFMSSIASPRFPALRSLRASSLAFAYFAINSCSNFAHSAGNSAHNPSFL